MVGKRLIAFNVFTIISVVIVLFSSSIAQRNYILNAETPPIERCYYYDQFGNYIHGSRLLYNCPTPTIVTQTDAKLEMTFEYNYYGNSEGYSGMSGTGITGYEYRKVEDGAVKISVELRYTEDNIVEYYRLRETVNYIADDYSKDESEPDFDKAFTLVNQTKISNYFEVTMETEFSDTLITQTKKVYNHFDEIDSFDEVTDFTFYEFDEDEVDYETIFRVDYHQYLVGESRIEVYKDIPSRDKYAIEPILKGTISNPNSVTDGRITANLHTPYEVFPDYENYTSLTLQKRGDGVSDINYFVNGNQYDLDYELIDEYDVYLLESREYKNYFDETENTFEAFDIIKYKDFYYYKNDDFKEHLIYQTNYGILIEQYSQQDGIKDESELSNYIGEIALTNSGVDDTILSLSNFQNLYYKNSIIWDNNPIIEYLMLKEN
jgi:hypothetical protein